MWQPIDWAESMRLWTGNGAMFADNGGDNKEESNSKFQLEFYQINGGSLSKVSSLFPLNTPFNFYVVQSS